MAGGAGQCGQRGVGHARNRLRELEKIQERTTENTTATQEGPSPGLLHRDGSPVVALINDRLVPVRIPNPDYVLIFCASPAPAGGESVVADGHRLIERLRDRAPGSLTAIGGAYPALWNSLRRGVVRSGAG